MPKSKSKSELLSGTCQDLLFSPKGGIEGLLLKVDGKTVQVSMPAHIGSVMAQKTGSGKRLRLLARADHSPKTSDAAHPVYEFEALADAAGEAIEWPVDGEGLTSMRGKVSRVHYAKHGEPNGVVLESGEFIHLRPHGMAAVGIGVGAKVSAKGELRMTILGTRMLEARHANGYDIE
jgi:hypothetical protein